MKQKIIETAFKEWGKFGFKDTSLLLIAKKLKITKAGLYRHFKSKDSLIEAMKAQYLSDFFKIKKDIIDECNNISSQKEQLKLFIKKYAFFFAKHPYYIKFGFIFIDKNDKKRLLLNDYKNLREKEQTLFRNIVISYNKNFKNKYKLLHNYTLTLLIFSIASSIFPKKQELIAKGLDDNAIDDKISQIFDIINNGFAIKKDFDMDMNEIENTVGEKIENLIIKNETKDKIFDAISEIITNEGIWNTSISKIAKKVGITKSSLYFYFKSKRDMISNLIINEMKKISSIIKENVSIYEDTYLLLYSFLITGYYYFRKNVNAISIFHWLALRDKSFNYKPKKFPFTAMEESVKKAIENNTLNNHDYDATVILALLNMIGITLIFYYKDNELINTNNDDIRLCYKLFLFGLQGGENEDKK